MSARGAELAIEIRLDDLTSEATRGLIRRHLQGMHAASPPESVHAFDVEALKKPGVTFWTAYVGDRIAGCCALARLDDTSGEIKSMRVADELLGQGVGRAMLEHLLREAKQRGWTRVWLETGSTPPFAPALKLYESAGFERCAPFGSYVEDPFSIFMTRAI